MGAKLQRAFLTLGFFALVTMMGMVALSLPSASDANKSTKPTWDWPQNSAALLLVQPLLVYLSGKAYTHAHTHTHTRSPALVSHALYA